MAEKIAVRPARKGMALAHPVSGILPDEGGEWANDQFTARRLLDKDVERVEPLDATAEEKPQVVETASPSDAPAPSTSGVVNPDPAPVPAAARNFPRR